MFYALATNGTYISENVNLFIGLGPFAVLRETSDVPEYMLNLIDFFGPLLNDL